MNKYDNRTKHIISVPISTLIPSLISVKFCVHPHSHSGDQICSVYFPPYPLKIIIILQQYILKIF